METNVLVVDDEPDFVELITHGLQANGFQCSGALTGMEAIKKVRQLSPDAVILDIMLPDLDGFTICEMLRREPANSSIAVLMMTCLGSQMSRLNGLSAGADDYLAKPVRLADLISHIRRSIQLRAERAAAST